MAKKEITLSNIYSFLEGNARYLKNIFGMFPRYKQEQVLYRLSICKDTCVKNEECEYCGCPPKKKAFVDKSCNKGDKFPDMMEEEDWELFKKENNIIINGRL
jgi:hypothetical protein